MASPTRFRLKVLSGPQAGAEMLLADGRRLIGHDDACDILLADEAVASRHAALLIERGQCSIEALEGALVVVDGRRVTHTALRAFQPFTLGGTQLAAGPADQPWPHIDLPAIGSSTPAVEPEAKPAPLQAPSAAAASPPATPPAAPNRPAHRRRRRRMAPLIGLIAVVLVAVLLLLLNGSGWGAAAPPDRQAELAGVEQQLKGLLVDYQSGADLRIERKNDRLTVRGYVPTAAARKQLRGAIEKVSPAVEVRVADTASLAEAAQSILEMYKVDLTAAPGEPGEVVIAGTTADVARWSQVKQTISTDVPRIAKLTDHVNRPVSVPTPAQPVAAVSQPDAIVNQTVPAPEAPVAEAAAPPPPPPSVSLAIQSINVGSSRWMVLASGERVFVGGQLGSGYVVTSIEPDQVVLARNGQETVIRVGARQ